MNRRLVVLVWAAGCGGVAVENAGTAEESLGIPEALATVGAALPPPVPVACTQAQIDAVFAPIPDNPTPSQRQAKITCNLTLSPTDVVYRALVVEGPEGSGVTIDCNGARLIGGGGTPNDGKDMVEVRSRLDGTTWRRPTDVTVRNCDIIGSVRVYGMGKNGEAPAVNESSHSAGHVQRVRAAAPTRITFDHLTVRGTGRNPVYFSPGVTYASLINSTVTGWSTRTGVYLDAESAYNTIRNNDIAVDVRDIVVGGVPLRRGPQLTLDTSSANNVFDNHFSSLLGGGIYLFRNCGEGGTVRHGTPSYNKIVNNVFYYDQYDGENPSILIGSRGDEWWRIYCDDDNGYPWGSSVDNRSFAQHNTVIQNQIFKLSVNKMIDQGDLSNIYNTIRYNQSVTAEIVRLAGCFVPSGFKDLLLHGQSLDVFRGTNDIPMCTGSRITCTDGISSYQNTQDCSIEQAPFNCTVSGNNTGCQKSPACPVGRTIVSIRAGCNLEYGTVDDSQLASVPGQRLQVFRQSDTVSDGSCWVARTRIPYGSAPIDQAALERSSVTVGCREYDANGGDCQVRGVLYCR